MAATDNVLSSKVNESMATIDEAILAMLDDKHNSGDDAESVSNVDGGTETKAKFDQKEVRSSRTIFINAIFVTM